MELLHSFGANHGTVTFISPAITYRITTGVFELYQKNENNSKNDFFEIDFHYFLKSGYDFVICTVLY